MWQTLVDMIMQSNELMVASFKVVSSIDNVSLKITSSCFFFAPMDIIHSVAISGGQHWDKS